MRRERTLKRGWRAVATMAAGLLLAGAVGAHAADITWDGSSTSDQNWTTATNWTGGVLPASSLTTDIAVFGNPTGLQEPTLTGAYSISGLSFTAGTWTLSGAGPLSVGSNGISFAAGTGGNTISLTSLVLSTAMPITVAPGDTLTISSVMSGSTSGLTVTGGGTANFSGANTYTGPTAVSGNSTLAAGVADALPVTTTLTLGAGDNTIGTYDLTGFSQTISGLVSAGTGTSLVTNSGSTLPATLTVTSGGTFAGIIQDGASTTALTVSGGTLTLSGANTYSGGTTITAGTIEVGNASALGTGTATITAGTLDLSGTSLTISGLADGSVSTGVILNGATATPATLTVTSGGTFSGVIRNGSSTMALTLNHGTLTLGGADNYTGATTVNGGTLTVGSGTAGSLSSSTSLTLGGGTFNLVGNTSGATSQTVSGLNLNPGASAVVVNTNGGSGTTLTLGDITRSLGATVDFTVPGSATINTTTANANFAGGQQTILGGYATVGGNTWAVSGTTTTAGAITGLADGSYNTGFAAGADVDAFGAASAPGAMTVNSIRFNTSSTTVSGVDATGGLVVATGGILDTGSGTGAVTFSNGTLTSGNGSDLIVIQNNTAAGMTIGSVIADNGGAVALTKSGAGLLTLTGVNTYTGGTVLNAGTLNINADSTLGTAPGSPTVNLTFAGSSTLQAGASFTLDSNRSVEIDAGITATFDTQANTLTVDGVIGGSGTLAKIGTGALLLAGADTYSGGTTITAGTVQVGNATALGTGTATITAGTLDLNGTSLTVGGLSDGTQSSGIVTNNGGAPATLTVNGTAATTFSGTIMDGASTTALTLAGGTLALSGTNTYTGGTTINGGVLQVTADANLGTTTGALTLGGGTLQIGGSSATFTTGRTITLTADSTLDCGAQGDSSTFTGNMSGAFGITLQGGGSGTYSGVIGTGTGALTTSGTGFWFLTGANTYTSATTVNNGSTLVIGDGTTNGSIASSTIADNGTLYFFRSDTITYAGTIIGDGALIQFGGGGTGTLVLTGNSSGFTGTTTVDSGTTLQVDGTLGASTSSVTINAGGNLAGAGAVNGNVFLTGGSSGTKGGIITGSGTITGNVTVQGGTGGGFGAIVGGTGTIVGNVNVGASQDASSFPGMITGGVFAFDSTGATIPASSSIGALHITGTLTLAGGDGGATSNGGAFQFKTNLSAGTAPGVGYDQIVVNGAATLSSGSYIVIRPLDNAMVANNTVLHVITTTGGVTDDGVIVLPTVNTPLVTWKGSVDGDDYDLTATRLSFASLASTPNNQAVAGALDGDANRGIGGAARTALLTDLDTLSSSPDQYNAALAALSPEHYGAVNDVSIRDAQRFNTGIADYLGQRRVGYPGPVIYASGGCDDALASTDPSPAMLKYTAAAADDATSRPIPHDQDFRAFVEPMGLFGHRDVQGDRLGYDYNGYGVMTGVDLKLSPEWIVGVAGGYLRSDLDYNQALGTATIDTARIGPYAGATFGRWLLDASVSFGYHWIDSTRAVDVPGLGAANATANYNAYDISSYLGLGYRFHPTKRVNIIPMASVDYTYFDNQGFTESGGPAGTSLAVASTGVNSLRSSLGVGANTWFRTSGVKVVPEISLAWIHEFFDDNKVNATFADGITPFTVQSGPGKYDGMTVGGGVSVLFRKNISAFLRYGLDYVPRDTAHTLGAGITIGF